MDALDELRAALHRDPRHVAEQARRIADAAQAAGDVAELSRALAVLGRARRSLGEIAVAELDLAAAVDAADAAGCAELAADARVGLAGVLSFAGRADEAFALLDEAERQGSERVRAHAALQRAIVEQRTGRLDLALAAYTRALPTLREIDEPIDVAMVLANRGVIRTQTGDLELAVADLGEASAIFRAEHHDFGVAQTEHGLGWALARLGDLPGALGHLDAAAEQFERLGHAALEVEVDRVEVLLAAGLVGPAARLAARTAERLAADGNHSQAAETWLLCAKAARLDGDPAGAWQHASRARELFAAQGSAAWERAAQLEVVRSGGQVDLGELTGLAEVFATVGNTLGATTAQALACQQAAESGDVDCARFLVEGIHQAARDAGVLEVRLLVARAEVAIALAEGDDEQALRAAGAGLGDLAGHVATLGATDARAAASAHGVELAQAGLRTALGRGRADEVLEWMERARAGRSRYAPPRPPADAHAAAELTELREVIRRLRELEHEGGDTTDLVRSQRDLEASLHRRSLRVAGTDEGRVAGPVSADDVRDVMVDRVLVSLAHVDDRLVGVAVGPEGSRLADLAPFDACRRAGTAASAALRSLAHHTGSAAARGDRLALLGRAVTSLDRSLAELLHGEAPVVLVLPPELHAAPWPLLPSLRGRRPVVAPSATWVVAAHRGPRAAPRGPSVVVAGPRLTEAAREATLVAACLTDSVVLAGADATVAAVTAALATAPMAHVAAHGHLRHDNPLWSSLELADGPLCVYDLERLPATPPTVVLSACDSGLTVRAGEELLGLSSSLLSMGTHSLVAAVCPLPDTEATARVMAALHARIAAGEAPAVALDLLGVGAVDDDDLDVVRCLACFGTR